MKSEKRKEKREWREKGHPAVSGGARNREAGGSDALDDEVGGDLLAEGGFDAVLEGHHGVGAGAAVADEVQLDGVAFEGDEFDVAAVALDGGAELVEGGFDFFFQGEFLSVGVGTMYSEGGGFSTQTSTKRTRKRRVMPPNPLGGGGQAWRPEVSSKTAMSMLMATKPTPAAMKSIITGSRMVVKTFTARSSSAS